jgi:ATP synthase subunit 6
MKNITLFSSPLEQFEILPLVSFYLGGLDFSITNEAVILFLIFFFSLTFIRSVVKQSDSSLYVIPNRWQIVIGIIYQMILSMISDNISGKKGYLFFPLVFSVFFYVANLNLIGLVPYSFTLTSHLIVTFALAIAIFLGINIICVRIHGLEFFSLFFPAGTSLVLGLLLVPIEVISYVFRPISLGIRLFANIWQVIPF